ncbi:Fe2+-dependent dioxygenase [Rosenbergiella australiborealis]|uniref:Fe2+-dependent dioxygenase n=1 Tax=Rosenbergiella australiborealis TaxID=1544696 RepID=A0ABS5T184_9GAMM|nr:Fe2+-dependent dioxygenase [Rosenbergiella australiborealis]MBT0726099.1 Fe2+-dependent dioxygenase [Rosenbergiella australiborealis]
MMHHIKGILNTEQLTALTQQLAHAEWIDGRVTTGVQGAAVKSNEQVNTQSALYNDLQQCVLQAINQHPQFFSATLPVNISSPLFNRYQGGGAYGFHVDGAIRREENIWLRTDISATLFLNDPESYQGGELVIQDTFGQHKVKLPAGDMVIYPSSSLHCVTPVITGQRLASFMWIQSMVRDEKKRAMLSQLDNDIQQLAKHEGSSEVRMNLLNLYHNLLREWSEV